MRLNNTNSTLTAEPRQTRADVYTRVTQQIVDAIEAGAAGEYHMPWHTSDGAAQFPVNAATGKRYRGINTLTLWTQAQCNGYAEHTWATFRQWDALGYPVKRGEKSSICVFWKPINADAETETDNVSADSIDAEKSQRWIARAFPLFNAEQVSGYTVAPKILRPDHEKIPDAEAFMAALKADISHGGNRAYYRPSTDHIQMPRFDAFIHPAFYYGVLAHEVTHWTGHASRLARDLTGRFGSESYAVEELIAELGAAFIAADLQLPLEPREENAAYIENWLRILKSDTRAIFTAGSFAQRAADYVNSLQPSASPTPTVRGREVSLTL